MLRRGRGCVEARKRWEGEEEQVGKRGRGGVEARKKRWEGKEEVQWCGRGLPI